MHEEMVRRAKQADLSSAHPLQRARRGVDMMSCRAVFDLDAIVQIYGALRLGISPSVPMI